MSLYEILCEITKKPQKIKCGGFSDLLTFDLKEKTIRSKRLLIVEKGKLVCNTIELEDGTCYDLTQVPFFIEKNDDQLAYVQKLYDDFLNSRPSAHADYANTNFRCKKSDELTFEQLLTGKVRNEARCCLEAYILLGAISGIFEWNNPNHWFWKGERGLVLYREWLI